MASYINIYDKMEDSCKKRRVELENRKTELEELETEVLTFGSIIVPCEYCDRKFKICKLSDHKKSDHPVLYAKEKSVVVAEAETETELATETETELAEELLPTETQVPTDTEGLDLLASLSAQLDEDDISPDEIPPGYLKKPAAEHYCPICPPWVTFTGKIHKEKHMKGHVDSNLKLCKVCDKKELSKTSLQSHMMTKHYQKVAFRCRSCKQILLGHSALGHHTLNVCVVKKKVREAVNEAKGTVVKAAAVAAKASAAAKKAKAAAKKASASAQAADAQAKAADAQADLEQALVNLEQAQLLLDEAQERAQEEHSQKAKGKKSGKTPPVQSVAESSKTASARKSREKQK